MNHSPKCIKVPGRALPILIGIGLALAGCSSVSDSAPTRDGSAPVVDTTAIGPVVSTGIADEGRRVLESCGPDIEPGVPLALVDIGAGDTPASVGGLSPDEALDASGITTIPIPTGNVEVLEYSRSYGSGPSTTFTVYEQMSLAATTTTPIDEVLTSIVESVEGSYEVEFVATDLGIDDDSESWVRLVPAQDGVDFPFYEIAVSEGLLVDVPGDLPDDLVSVRVYANTERSGPLPPVSGQAPGCADKLSIATGLGWTLDSWKVTTQLVNSGGGVSANFLGLEWTVGPGHVEDMAGVAEDMAERLSNPTLVYDLDDRQVYRTGDELWSVIDDPTSTPGLRAKVQVQF